MRTALGGGEAPCSLDPLVLDCPDRRVREHARVLECRGVEASPAPRPRLEPIEAYDPQFVQSYTAIRERILKDGAIPAKYKIFMGIVTDAIAAHPDGVTELADVARAAGATEAEIAEAVEVGYLYGGTAALVMGTNAFIRTDKPDQDTRAGS